MAFLPTDQNALNSSVLSLPDASLEEMPLKGGVPLPNGTTVGPMNGVRLDRSHSPNWRGHDRSEVTRIIIQALQDMGYQETASALISESSTLPDSLEAAEFRRAILSGDWELAESFVTDSKVPVVAPSAVLKIIFLIREQRFLEMIEQAEIVPALTFLQTRITPLGVSSDQLHHLSGLVMCSSPAHLKEQARWDGANGTSRTKLFSSISKLVSPHALPPEHRLADIFDQVKNVWEDQCLYHNTNDQLSLLKDHSCTYENMPTTTLVELSDIKDEVWIVSFSRDGTKLAVAGKNKRVCIYETETFSLLCTLKGEDRGIAHVSWSPDGTKLIACSIGKNHKASVWCTSTAQCLQTLPDFSSPVSAAAWSLDGQSFVTASRDLDRALIKWDAGSYRSTSFSDERMRVFDVAVSPDGQRLVAVLNDKIQVYKYQTRQKVAVWNFESAMNLTSISFSSNSNEALVGMNNNSLQLIDVCNGHISASYIGLKQRSVVIRSSLGGVAENFVVGGSEDGRLLAWKRTGELAMSIEAHDCTTINCAQWNPANPYMVASAGDDGRVRIWIPARDVERVRKVMEEKGVIRNACTTSTAGPSPEAGLD